MYRVTHFISFTYTFAESVDFFFISLISLGLFCGGFFRAKKFNFFYDVSDSERIANNILILQ